ncbi:hypothetical protein [Yinghuangia sp. YIM S10712]|uniref:hypothetical protein n=1 Tax=Yinghuangia sp. YIM S10712 TaxID=3436930 RepID=UPI003F536C72
MAWFAGHVPGHRGGIPSDGPTARDREVLAALDRAAAAEGRTVTARDLAAELGVHPDSARRLLRRVVASVGRPGS